MYFSDGLVQQCLNRPCKADGTEYEELITCMRIGEYFERAVHTDPLVDRTAVDALQREKILCAGNAVMLIHVIFLPAKALVLPMELPREEVEQLQALQGMLRSLCEVHLFSDVGKLLILLSSSHVESVSPGELHDVLSLILRRNPEVDRMVISEWKKDSTDLFHAYNSIERFEEYQNFIQKPARLQYVQQDAQMTIPFAEHSHHFDCLSRDIVSAMLRDEFDSGFWSGETVSLILQSAVGSIEALHRCMQTFVTSLGHCLLERRVMDSKEIDQGEMLAEVMTSGHNEQVLRDSICRLLEDLYRRHKTFDERVGAKRVREVCSYIAEHISDYELSVPVLSKQCGINRNLLASDFKKYTGRSLSWYLIEARVGCAKRLMEENPALGLAEIADRSGYTSISTMYRNFQKVEGCSPGEFRERAAAGLVD